MIVRKKVFDPFCGAGIFLVEARLLCEIHIKTAKIQRTHAAIIFVKYLNSEIDWGDIF